MRRLLLLPLLLTLLFAPGTARALELVKGDLYFDILSFVQANLQYTTEVGVDRLQVKPLSFDLKRARLVFVGGYRPRGLKFVVQLEGLASPPLLDIKAIYTPHKMLTIMVGRYLANWTFYMPRPVTMTDTINYPLLSAFWPLRQTGVTFTLRPIDMLQVDLGVFNGWGTSAKGLAANTWADNNMGKDIMLVATIKPLAGLDIKLGLWYGMPLALDALGSKVPDDQSKMGNLLIFGGGVMYRKGRVLAAGELYLRNHNLYSSGYKDRSNYDTTELAAHVTGGFRFLKPLEAILRFDLFLGGAKILADPNDATKGLASSKHRQIQLTAGINWFLYRWMYIQLNYTLKMTTDPYGKALRFGVDSEGKAYADPGTAEEMGPSHTVLMQFNFTI